MEMNLLARSRAWRRNPELKAGWPQQVWASGKSNVTPAWRSTPTIASPTWGENWSTRQVMNIDALMSLCAISKVTLCSLPCSPCYPVFSTEACCGEGLVRQIFILKVDVEESHQRGHYRW